MAEPVIPTDFKEIQDEPWLTEPVKKLIQICGNQLAIDIGANYGTWTNWMVNHFHRVVSVEPDPRCPEISGVEFHRNIIGDCVGLKTLWLSDRSEQNHTSNLHPLHQSGGTPLDVIQKTFDVLCENRVPDFVKIDVEGAEDKILNGIEKPELYATTAFLIESHDRGNEISNFCLKNKRPFEVISHPCGAVNHCWFAIKPITKAA